MNNAEEIYNKLARNREAYLERARDASLLTLPQLMPQEGHRDQAFKTPYQSLGARGVNNLASKLLLALLPPSQPFFRLKADPIALQREAQGDPTLKTDLDAALAKIEQAIMTEVDASSIRISIFAAIKQLIVSGNALLYLPESGGIRTFRLDRYVLKRDPMGNVLRIITKENISPKALPEGIKLSEEDAQKDEVVLYTWAEKEDKGWTVTQSIGDVELTRVQFDDTEMPFIPLRITALDGEDYGSSIVEESLGDLISLEQLSKVVVEGARMAARSIFLVSPNSSVDIRELSTAPNGSFVTGLPEEVRSLQVEKFADMRIASDTINRLTESLSFAFLLNSAIQRSAERVTATEIRLVAQELEDTLGGVYSVLSQELQLPLVRKLLRQLEDKGQITKLPPELVKPVVITGLDALGRGRELNATIQALQTAASVLGAEQVARVLDASNFFQRVFTGVGVDPTGLVKSQEQLAQEAQALQQQQMIQSLGPNVIREGAQLLQNQQQTTE